VATTGKIGMKRVLATACCMAGLCLLYPLSCEPVQMISMGTRLEVMFRRAYSPLSRLEDTPVWPAFLWYCRLWSPPSRHPIPLEACGGVISDSKPVTFPGR